MFLNQCILLKSLDEYWMICYQIKSNKNIQWVFEIAVPKRRIICDKNKPMFCEVNRI